MPALPLFAQLRRFTLAVIAAAETAADFAGILYTDAPASGEAEAAEPFETIELEKRALGQTLLKLADGYGGTRMEWTDRDYLISAAKLVLGGVQVEPQAGDQIRETVGDAVHVYEALAPGGEPAWRWSDPHRRMLRVHAKHVGTEPRVNVLPLGPPLTPPMGATPEQG